MASSRPLVLALALGTGTILAAASCCGPACRAHLCSTRLRVLGLAAHQYIDRADGRFPAADTWDDALKPYIDSPDEAFACPELRNGKGGYAFNAHLAGSSFADVKDPSRTVLLFEADAGPTRSGGLERVLSKPRHGKGITVVFVDGHVERVPPGALNQLVWKP